MKIVKILAWTALAYVLVVVLFEAWLGHYQPQGERLRPISITTVDAQGKESTRMLTRWEVDGTLYLSAHHWPRAWYHAARANPNVKLTTMDGVTANYLAVPVEGAEFDAVNRAQPIPLVARILMGFAPRQLLRMEPAPATAPPATP